MHVPAADVYITYRCNMRCRHCFVGSALEKSSDLPVTALTSFMRTAREKWGTREVSLLGGEPTLYPQIDLAIQLGHELGQQIRIVSNGGSSLLRLMDRHDPKAFELAVSVDAASARRHDAIRRTGSFESAMRCITVGRQKGRKVSAILSVGRHNLDQALDTLRLLGDLDVDHVNVHYVTDRGFATADMLVGPVEWLALKDEIQGSPGLPTVRFEGTFKAPGQPLPCAVEQESMLMLFPDRRVYACTMYVGLPEGNTYEWRDGVLVFNDAFRRRYSSAVKSSGHCPAIRFLNATLPESAEAIGCTVGCIFDKEDLPARPVSLADASRATDRRE